MSIDQYDFIEVPGANGIRIPIVKRTDGFEEDTTGVRVPDWMVHISNTSGTTSTLNGYETFTELFGWYCESSRHVKGDATNHLYTSATLWHSDIFIVTQNGIHNQSINKWLTDGTITDQIIIHRIIRTGDAGNYGITVIQELIFQTCHWCGMHNYLDWNIARFTACSRVNTVAGIKQNGVPIGKASCIIDYVNNTVSTS
ncbi:MAG: hypothetical protein LBD36_02370 [Holosporales bacterium]|jgi:hypothetical protein|nr:hypothetical protein [Holosporales bacterium]